MQKVSSTVGNLIRAKATLAGLLVAPVLAFAPAAFAQDPYNGGYPADQGYSPAYGQQAPGNYGQAPGVVPQGYGQPSNGYPSGEYRPQQGAPMLSPEQLESLVAPIALYPDPLLSQVLVAATYPDQITAADQFLRETRGLSGQQLVQAAAQQNWDPSVQALIPFGDVLHRLASDIQWTSDLGQAFVNQQADVMNAVQVMRQRAQAAGRLQSTPQQVVGMEDQGGQEALTIEPSNPDEMYVPNYDPYYVWGAPAYPYPVCAYPDYGFGFFPGVSLGFFFGGWGGWGGWGWHPNWFGRSVIVNGGFFTHYGFHTPYGVYGGFGHSNIWRHDPSYRVGNGFNNNTRYNSANFGPSHYNTASIPRGTYSNGYRGNYNAPSGYPHNVAPPSAQHFASPAGGYNSGYRAPSYSYNRSTVNNGGSNYPAQHYSTPAYSAPRYSSYSAPRYSAPAQHYSAPAQHYSAPQSHYSAPAAHYSAPASHSSGGGGGFHGGGGGGGHSGGGHR